MAPPKVFVAMPFQPGYDTVYTGIKDAATMAGMEAVRVDEEVFTGSIVSRIASSIETADFVVAVVSEDNGNVYYEIGLAHCQRKPVVLLTSDPKALKFDLRDHRAVVYDPSDPQGLVKALTRTLSVLRNNNLDEAAALADRLGGGTGRRTDVAAARKKVEDTLKAECDLQEPVNITAVHKLANGDLAVEAQDFFGTNVKAIVDVNGIVRRFQRQ